MRVAYVLHRFPYLTETFVLNEMRGMEREGVEVRVYSLLPPKGTLVHPQAQALLARTTYAPLLSRAVVAAQLHYLLRAPLRYLRALAGTVARTWREPRVLMLMLALFPKSVYFARLMEESGVQHVHAHFVWLEGLAAGIVRALTGLPFSITPHAFGLYTRRRASVARELESASRIVTISEANRRHIAGLSRRLARTPVEVVHCGVDTALWRPPEGGTAGRAGPAGRANGAEEPVRLASVGRAVEKKGHEDLLAACHLLRERGVRFACRILAGDGEGAARLRALVEGYGLGGQVTLLGPSDDAGVRALLHDSDVFVLASRIARDGDRDGIPVVLMEAMACGLPVVSTRVSGIPELVRHGGSGLLVAPGDPGALAAALQRLAGDAGLRARMGDLGRARVAEAFGIDGTVAAMAALFRESRRAGQPAPAPAFARAEVGR